MEISRQEEGFRIRARKYTLGDVARLLHQLLGEERTVFIAGTLDPDTPLRAGDLLAAAQPPGTDITLPATEWTFRPGVRAALFRAGRRRDPVTSYAGVLSPADLILRRRPLADLAATSTAVFIAPAGALLRHLPPFHRSFRSAPGLVRAVEELLAQAAMDGVGFFRSPNAVVRFGPCAAPGGFLGSFRSASRRIRTARRDGWMFVWWTLRTLRARKNLLLGALRRFDLQASAGEAAALAGFGWGGFWRASRRPCRPLWHDPGGPVREVDADLLDGGRILRDAGPADAPFAWVTLFLGSAVCGSVGIPLHDPPPEPERLVRGAWEEFSRYDAKRFLRQLAREWFDEPDGAGKAPTGSTVGVQIRPRMELILATRDRPEDLTRLLASLRCVSYPVALHVIDSAPRDDSTRTICRREGLRYSLCPHPGKSRALNLGIRGSDADILLFTDDDARVDAAWPERLLDGFDHPGVAAVTGLVLPMKVSTTAEVLFERHMDEYEMGGLRRGHVEREFALPHSPFRAAKMGTGVNMAVHRSVFGEIGFFDEALSPGTPARAGEEIDLYFRILRAGRAIVYTPRAIVWHAHRDSPDKLAALLYNYGVSSGAFATRWLLRERAPAAYYYLWRWNLLGLVRHAWAFRRHYPPGLLLREARGALAGPGQYLRSVRLQREFDRTEGRHGEG